jgi:hypothetical protein
VESHGKGPSASSVDGAGEKQSNVFFKKKSVKWASKGRTGVSLLYPLCDQFSPETERWHVNKSKSSSSGVSLSIANSKGSSEHVEGF